jgi:hypothetical protein
MCKDSEVAVELRSHHQPASRPRPHGMRALPRRSDHSQILRTATRGEGCCAVAQKKAWESGHGLRYCRLLYSTSSTSANEGSRHFANPHASNPHAASRGTDIVVWSGLPRVGVVAPVML